VSSASGNARPPTVGTTDDWSHAGVMAGLGLVNLVCGVYARIRVSSGEVGLVVDIA